MSKQAATCPYHGLVGPTRYTRSCIMPQMRQSTADVDQGGCVAAGHMSILMNYMSVSHGAVARLCRERVVLVQSWWDNAHNQKYVLVVLLKMTWISEGKVATADRYGGQMHKLFMLNFQGFSHTNNHQNRLILAEIGPIQKIIDFWETVYRFCLFGEWRIVRL